MNTSTLSNIANANHSRARFDLSHAAFVFDKNNVMDLFSEIERVIYSYAKPSYVYQGEVEFKELYAHSRSNIMFDALNELIPESLNPVGVMLLDAYGQPVHYVHKITLNGDIYFIDAYGLFTDLEQIRARYGRFVIKGFHLFDANELSTGNGSHYKATKTLTNSVDESNVFSSYTGSFNANLVQTLLENILSFNKVFA